MYLPPDIEALLLPSIETTTSPWHISNRPFARIVRDRLHQRGQTRQDLHHLMQWSKNTTKSFRAIDQLLSGEIPHELEPSHDLFTRKALEALSATPREIQQLLAEDIHFLDERARHHQRHRLHQYYRAHGPTLQCWPRYPRMMRHAPRFIFAQITLSPENPVPPPTEEIHSLITDLGLIGVIEHFGNFRHDTDLDPGKPLDSHDSFVQHLADLTTPGTWRYHRLPDDIHEFPK
jgi:hypothetical protein